MVIGHHHPTQRYVAKEFLFEVMYDPPCGRTSPAHSHEPAQVCPDVPTECPAFVTFVVQVSP